MDTRHKLRKLVNFIPPVPILYSERSPDESVVHGDVSNWFPCLNSFWFPKPTVTFGDKGNYLLQFEVLDVNLSEGDVKSALDLYVDEASHHEYSAFRLKNILGVDALMTAARTCRNTLVEVNIMGARVQELNATKSIRDFTDGNLFPELTYLSLENLEVVDNDNGIGKCYSGNSPPKLKYLSLRGCGLNVHGVRSLSQTFSDMQLRYLVLGDNPGVNRAIDELSDSISNSTTLTHLDVSGCVLHAAAAQTLCDAIMDCDQMVYLNVSGCQLRAEGIMPLARTVISMHQSISTLDISRNGIGEFGAMHVANALRGNMVLRRLNVANNDLSSGGGQEIMKGMASNSSLKELILDNNGLQDKFAEDFGEVIASQQNLRMLSCRDDSMSTRGEVALIFSLQNTPLEYLFVGKGEPLLNIIGRDSFQEFILSPLTYAVRHGWKTLAKYLITCRNSDSMMSPGSSFEQPKSVAKVEDDDAADALHIVLTCSDDLYHLSDRLDLLQCMIGKDGCDGLMVRSITNTNWFTPDRSNVISSSVAEFVEDFWCCAACRSPPRLTEALELPVHGWNRFGYPDFNDSSLESKSFGQGYASFWKSVKQRSHRYAEHGFWSVYWCPRENRSFCSDKRLDSFEKCFWLPNPEEHTLFEVNGPETVSFQNLNDEIARIRMFAAKDIRLLYLEDESLSWLASMLQKKKSHFLGLGGLVRSVVKYRDKLEKRVAGWTPSFQSHVQAMNIAVPDNIDLTSSPSSHVVSSLVCYVLCIAWFDCRQRSGKKYLFERGVPWIRRGLTYSGERRTALMSAVLSRHNEAAELMLRRRAPKLSLGEVNSKGELKRTFSSLESKELPEEMSLQGNLRLAHLLDNGAVGGKEVTRVILHVDPDLLLVNSSLVTKDAQNAAVRRSTALTIAASFGWSFITQSLLSMGAKFDDNSSFEDINYLLFAICAAPVSSEDITADYALGLLGSLQEKCGKNCDDSGVHLDHHPLFAAVDTGKTKIVNKFLHNLSLRKDSFLCDAIGQRGTKASVNKWRTIEGWTLLSRAVFLGHIDIVRVLLEAHANPIAVSSEADFQFDSHSHLLKRGRVITNMLLPSQAKIHPAALDDIDDTSVIDHNGSHINQQNQEQQQQHVVPNAHGVALLRHHRQSKLMEAIEDSKSAQYDHEAYNSAKAKLKLSQEILDELNSQNSVKQYRNIWITKYSLKSAIGYTLFILLFTLVAFWHNGFSTSKFLFNELASAKTIDNELPLDDSAHSIKVFSDVGNEGDLWSYLQNTLLDNLYPDGFSEGWLDQHNRLIGGIHIFQIREENVCKEAVNDVWKELTTPGAATDSCYTFNPNAANYSYDVVLPNNNSNIAAAIIGDLEAGSWIDGATQSVRIEYAVGNVGEDLMQLAHLSAHFLRGGDAIPSSDFIALPAVVVGNFGISDVLIIVVAISFIGHIIQEVTEVLESSLVRYFEDRWNMYDLFISICGLSWCTLILFGRLEARDKFFEFESENNVPIGLRVFDLWEVGLMFVWSDFILSITLVMSYLKFIKYLQYVPGIGPDMLSLFSTLLSVRVFTFALFVLFFVVSVGLGLFVRFGAHSEDFASFGLSVFAVYSSLLGESYFDAMTGGGTSKLIAPGDLEGSKSTGIVFFVFLSFVGTMILANIFINVTGSVYDDAHDESEREWEHAVNNKMMDNQWNSSRKCHDRSFWWNCFDILCCCFRGKGGIRVRNHDHDNDGSTFAQLQGDGVRSGRGFSVAESAIAAKQLQDKLERYLHDTEPFHVRTKSFPAVNGHANLIDEYWSRHELLRASIRRDGQVRNTLNDIEAELNCYGVDIAHNSAWWRKESHKEEDGQLLLLPDFANEVVADRNVRN